MCTCDAPGGDGSVLSVPRAIPYTDGLTDLGDLAIWPDPEDPQRFFVLPLVPFPSRTLDGAPRISLLDAGDRGFFQLSAEWAADPARLEAIRADLEQMTEAPVILAAPDLSEVTATLTDPDGTPLAEASPSDLPPYNALFNLTVEGDMQGRVADAMNAMPARLILRYDALLPRPTHHELRLTGTLGPDVSMTALSDALQSGALRFEAPADVQIDDVLSEFLLMLMTTHRPDAEGTISVTLTREGSTNHPITVAADLGALLARDQTLAAILPSALIPAPNTDFDQDI